MKPSLKLILTFVIAFSSAIAIITAQSCQFGKSDSYDTLSTTDISHLVDSLPDQQKRMLAQTESQRKEFLKQMTRMFALAQAAQKEGLDKTETFKRQDAIFTDQLLVNELMKKNPDDKYSEDEGKAYAAAHDKEFQADLKAIAEGGELPPADQIDMMKSQWGEMKVRAERARKGGIEKDPKFHLQMKFHRANRLAQQYSNFLEKKLKPSPEELKKYLEDHPEADLAKIKAKGEALLQLVKNGENFEALANQNNEDNTRGTGGSLGDWFSEGQGNYPPDFLKAVFALKKGETSDLFRSQVGFHIIRVDDRRTVVRKPTPNPSPSQQPASQTSPTPTTSPAPTGPVEEVKARHIFLSTQEADGMETALARKKVQRAMEDATLQYPVQAPADFAVNVGGLRKDRAPVDTGSGRIITPGKQ